MRRHAAAEQKGRNTQPFVPTPTGGGSNAFVPIPASFCQRLDCDFVTLRSLSFTVAAGDRDLRIPELLIRRKLSL
jgi:hypothetical protein